MAYKRAISASDPQAVEKLTGKLEQCKQMPLTTDTNIVNLTEKFERKEITENRRNKQNSPEKNFPLQKEAVWK